MLKENNEFAGLATENYSGESSLPPVLARVEEMAPTTAHIFDQLKSRFFNEMLDDASMQGDASKKIEHWLCQHTLEQLAELNQQAKQHFLW